MKGYYDRAIARYRVAKSPVIAGRKEVESSPGDIAVKRTISSGGKVVDSTVAQ